jgi:hypothetical protein
LKWRPRPARFVERRNRDVRVGGADDAGHP